MTEQTSADPAYVLGRTDAETERLMLQSRTLARLTRNWQRDLMG